MKRLIVAADDFGLTDGVSAGIAEAIAAGVVTCTGAMVAFPGAADRVARHYTPALSGRVGLHLQLSDGEPCAPLPAVPSLVDGNGRFADRHDGSRERIGGEIAIEWQAQLARLGACGVDVAHVDSHHHVHRWPVAIEPYAALARGANVPARGGPPAVREALSSAGVPVAGWLDTSWFGGVLTVDRFLAIVARAFAIVRGRGSVELMCHPGRCDDQLRALSPYAEEREQELRVLCDPILRTRLDEMGVELMPAAGLAR